MDTRAKELVKIGDGLFTKKRQHDELNQEIAENFYPLRADFTSPFTLGEDFSGDLMESFPIQARETLGNAPSSMLRQGQWFNVRTGFEEIDELPANATWLESATHRFKRLIYDRRANFVRSTVEVDHDYVTFGGGVLSVGENSTREHFLFRSWHQRDCVWMENADCKVDHLQRTMPTTARNIMANPAWAKNAHRDIRQAAEKDPTTEFKIRHVVLPADEMYGDDKVRRRRLMANGMQFVSLYIDCDHEVVLGEGALPVFCYVTPRWRTISNYQYGFSPAAVTALPDGRMIQSMARILLEQGEKAVDPPTIGKGDIFRDEINLYAGGHTHVDLEDSDDIRKVFQTVDQGGNLGLGLEMKQDVRLLIAESFLLNKLMLPNTREMTAFETQARLDEFRRAALPFFGPIESEYHLPMLDIAFQMAVRNKSFDFAEMPDDLQGQDVTFTFDTPLNTAEGRQTILAYQESLQIISAAVQTDKTIIADYDIKQATKDAVRATGANADWILEGDDADESNEAAALEANLVKAAELGLAGAGVAGAVADSSIKLQEAGLA
ncbi:MAG: portal protein [Mesorhizobium sp.]|nr:portal protein [Mesorhizobium sp.]MCO5159631.1 portal protein [Mesorhizobium sp.]